MCAHAQPCMPIHSHTHLWAATHAYAQPHAPMHSHMCFSAERSPMHSHTCPRTATHAYAQPWVPMWFYVCQSDLVLISIIGAIGKKCEIPVPLFSHFPRKQVPGLKNQEAGEVQERCDKFIEGFCEYFWIKHLDYVSVFIYLYRIHACASEGQIF